MRKCELIQIEGTKKGRGKPKIIFKRNGKKWHVNQGNNREYDFRKNRMAKTNTYGWPWLVCWESIVDPKNIGTKAL